MRLTLREDRLHTQTGTLNDQRACDHRSKTTAYPVSLELTWLGTAPKTTLAAGRASEIADALTRSELGRMMQGSHHRTFDISERNTGSIGLMDVVKDAIMMELVRLSAVTHGSNGMSPLNESVHIKPSAADLASV